MELVLVWLVHRIPEDPTARDDGVHAFSPRAHCKGVISHLDEKSGMKREPVECFREADLHIILQRVCKLCQTEDDLSEDPKSERNTREPQKLTIKSGTPILP